MKEAIFDFMFHDESRLNFIAAAESSFEQYKQTGLHVTIDEFNLFIEALEDTVEAPGSTCHK